MTPPYQLWVLYRNPLPSDTKTVTEETEHFINNIISDAVPLLVSLDEIKSETLLDLELCSIIQSVNTDFWDKKTLQEFYKIKWPHCEKFNFVKIKQISFSKIIEKK